jgi:periplasmic divalent cation tolerance protein
MPDILMVFCTFPDLEKARLVSSVLIESGLAACVNLCPGIESIYCWQNRVESHSEVLAIFKTTAMAYPAFESRLRELHPYDIPEIVAMRPEQVSETYAKWVTASVLVDSLV